MARFQLTSMTSHAKNNYRCVQSLNISVDVAKCMENVHKFTQYTHFCPLQKKTCPNWTIYSWQGFNSLVCLLMLKTNYRCVQSLNISVDVAKCLANVQNFNQFTHFLSVKKNDLSWLNNLFMARFQLISMSSYAKNKLQMCSVTQHQCRRHKCVENVHTLIHYTHFLSVIKNDLSRLNNLFMARFQLIRMSSHAKNKLQMCSVTQHQCWRSQLCGKCSQIHQVHSLFVRHKKRLVLIKQSIHGKFSTH